MQPDLTEPGLRFPRTRPLDEAVVPNRAGLFSTERTAVHSGKLGDIIYSLPTLKMLGVDHLILNAVQFADDPLRTFSVGAARALTPLLLAQSYLRKVSITQRSERLETQGSRLEGIDHNLDAFRNVSSFRFAEVFAEQCPGFLRANPADLPAHLGELFAASQGVRVDLTQAWLELPVAMPEFADSVVVSLTHNWRTYPDTYWKLLCDGLSDLVFVGTPEEWKAFPVRTARFVPTANHLQLAQVIASGFLFLGTVSFPYSLAEGLKVPRGVEICLRQLNAFPTGDRGFTLPPSISAARHEVAIRLPMSQRRQYEFASQRISRKPSAFAFSVSNQVRTRLTPLNRSRNQWLRERIAAFRRALPVPLHSLQNRLIRKL